MSQLNQSKTDVRVIGEAVQTQETGSCDSVRSELVVVSVHTTLGISGVTVAGARLAGQNLPGITWIPMVVGEEGDLTDERINNSALAAVDPQCVVTWPKGASPLQKVIAVREAFRILGADVVVGHDAPVAYVACALEESRGMRSILWHHSSGYDGDDVLLRCGGLAHAWCGVSDGLTAHAQRILRDLHGDAACVESAPVMVDVPPRPVAWVPNTRTLRLVYCGRLAHRHKRIMDLVKLADALVARGVRFHMTIAGEGPAGKMLREACKPHLKSGRIALVGAVSPDRAVELYGAHDVGILVSESEGMPLSIAECMGQGRPVAVTTGCGGASELVRDGENGIVVATGDMETMANRLTELANKRERIKSMGINARDTVAARMSIGSLRQTYLSMIHAAKAAPEKMQEEVAGWWNRVLGALEFIGASTQEEVEKLRQEVVKELLQAGRVVDIKQLVANESCAVALSAERLMRGAVAQCVKQGAQKIMIYGAGAHAKKVARVIGQEVAIVGIVDDAAAPQDGTTKNPRAELAGKPIMSPGEACKAGFDALILCSDEFEEVLAARAQAWCAKVPVVRLYGRWGEEDNVSQGGLELHKAQLDEVSSQAA